MTPAVSFRTIVGVSFTANLVGFATIVDFNHACLSGSRNRNQHISSLNWWSNSFTNDKNQHRAIWEWRMEDVDRISGDKTWEFLLKFPIWKVDKPPAPQNEEEGHTKNWTYILTTVKDVSQTPLINCYTKFFAKLAFKSMSLQLHS